MHYARFQRDKVKVGLDAIKDFPSRGRGIKEFTPASHLSVI